MQFHLLYRNTKGIYMIKCRFNIKGNTYILDENTVPEICRLGEKVFGVEKNKDVMEGAKKAIEALSDFCFKTLGLKSTLLELGITDEHFRDMAEHACINGTIKGVKTLTPDDVVKIYQMCL